MKKMLLFPLILPAMAFAQKIEKTTIDQFDSIKTTKTREEVLARSPNNLHAFVASFTPLSDKLKNNSELKRNTVYLIFNPDRVMSVSAKNTVIKVQFADQSIAEYNYKGEFKIFGSDQIGSVYFDVYEDDKLFTNSIKAVRIAYRDGTKDFEIKDSNSDMLKKMLLLVKNTN